MPWKNGGGETREIVASPAGATLDTLDWRVSLATVAADGPFSVFKDVERTLCVIRGAGIQLQVGDLAPVDLHVVSEPYTFDGEAATSSRLINGPIEDLNVMSRRGRFRHRVRRFALNDTLAIDTNAQTLIVYCQRSDIQCVAGDVSGSVHADDSVIVDAPVTSIRLVTTQPAEIIVVEFFQE